MLHLLSLIVGIAATLFVFWLRKETPRKRHLTARQKQLLPHTDDHKRFHEGIQGQQDVTRKILRLAPWSDKDPLDKSTEVGIQLIRRMLLLSGTTIFQ